VAITREQVRHIARLANLEFSDEEIGRFTLQLDAILEYVAHLDRLDTSAVEPTSHIGAAAHPARDDAVRGSIEREAAMRNAPDTDGALFKVPRVLG
jgi:aspartyl-tRNA(Asn)/glutamyl-tRNA(Gln) amidotransferase subunit C